MTRGDSELKGMRGTLRQQAERLDRVEDALESKADLYDDLRHSLKDMSSELADIKAGAGRLKAMQNIQKATTAVLNLAQTFDTLDVNSSGSIDIGELRRGLHMLGMDSHSAQANMIIQRYTHDQVIDIKTFTTLVRDIHLLLTFDQDGSCAFCHSPALTHAARALPAPPLAVPCGLAGGAIDEWRALVIAPMPLIRHCVRGPRSRSAALRFARREGKCPLHGASAAHPRARRWRSSPTSSPVRSGTLDAEELKPALEKLGLHCSDESLVKIIRAWDADDSGKLDLLEFTDLVRSLTTFAKYDKDGSGDIDVAELRVRATPELGPTAKTPAFPPTPPPAQKAPTPPVCRAAGIAPTGTAGGHGDGERGAALVRRRQLGQD